VPLGGKTGISEEKQKIKTIYFKTAISEEKQNKKHIF